METEFDTRLARIIERRRKEMLASSPTEDHVEHGRRLAYARVTSELPRLLAQLTSAVLELNDRLSETDLRVTLRSFGHTPSAEATYVFGTSEADEGAPELIVAVDFSGKVSASLRTRQARSLVRVSDLNSIDRLEILSLLATLLEAPHGA